MKQRFLMLALTLWVIGAGWTVRPAAAHGRVDVGEYELVIGFSTEPAYQGEPNGLDLAVRTKADQTPVTDLADTLKVEIIRGDTTRALNLRAVFGKDGSYTANVLPTEAGDYTWHIFGDINGTPVDVSMTSGEGTFGIVQPKADVSFPSADPTTADLVTQIQAVEARASQAWYVGIAGVVVGLIGLATGVIGLRGRRTVDARTS
jgi:hypothetical protein